MSAITASQIIWAGPARFDFELARDWTMERRTWSVGIVAVYLITLFALEKFMKNRRAYALQKSLICWNVCLTVFSAFGLYYTASEFLATNNAQGFTGLYCRTNQLFRGPSGYWVWLFTLSKVVELGDSYFLVLRKRPLTFLQYFHHSLTLVYCWWSYVEAPSFNRIGTLMNYLVHTVMYAYFLARSLRVAVPAVVAQAVTGLQILQFVIAATLLCYGHYQVVVNGEQCDWPVRLATGALVMNACYLYLFAQFFYNAYVRGHHSTLHTKTTKAE